MICPKCGKMVPDGRTQCPQCDAILPYSTPATTGASTQVVYFQGYQTPQVQSATPKWVWAMPFIVPMIVISVTVIANSGILAPGIQLTVIGAGNPAAMYGSGDINVVIQNNGKKTAEESKIQVKVSGDRLQTTTVGWTGGDIPPGKSSSMNVHVNVTSSGQGKYSISSYYNGIYMDSWP